MSEFKDYFSTVANFYTQYRPNYPSQMFQFLSEHSPERRLALDCGCGNGQASVSLAEHFQHVIASDPSSAQIQKAQQRDNIRYVVAAEKLCADDGSADLITVAQAFHWFNQAKFFAEVERALKPGGILAIWGYQLLSINDQVDAVLRDFFYDVVGPYWPEERALLDNGYASVHFPYPALETPDLVMKTDWQFEQLLGYLKSWSAVKRYQEEKNVDPVSDNEDKFLAAWGDPTQALSAYWPMVVYVGQKPC